MTTGIPREEITIGRPLILEVVKTVSRRRDLDHNERIEAAITTIANIGHKQGYKTPRWLVPAEAAWVIAHLVPAHHIYPDADDTHPAVIAQNALRDALTEQAPATCKALKKQYEVGDLANCGHCRGPWSLTHTCEGQPEPILPTPEAR